jgi:hypothetical protein
MVSMVMKHGIAPCSYYYTNAIAMTSTTDITTIIIR